MRQGEEVGNRLADARRALEDVEYERVVALLMPLRTARDLPAALGTEAALLETTALVALQRTEQATEACRRAVALAGYDPTIARNQSPRVQAVCTTAAEQARRELIATRRIGIGEAVIRPGEVAWTPTRVEVRFDGDLSGLVTQAEVAIGDQPAVTVGLPASGQPTRVVTLDANDAAPGARVSVTPLVRDAHGVLVRAPNATVATISRDEAAVRFGTGSDEGPLRVDGVPVARRATVGSLVPLEPGPHTIVVASPSGEARAQIRLRRGEVALLTMRSSRGVSALDVLRWTTTGLAVVAAGTGGVFQVFAAANANQLEIAANTRDPATGLPSIRYSDVAYLDENRQQFQSIALGLFIGAGVSAALATVLWVVPGGSRAAPARTVGVAPTRGGGALSISF